MNTVIILRGASGCGKTTYAKQFLENNLCSICISADEFPGYITAAGYTWTPETCKAAHQWAHALYEESLEANAPLIVVDNTNLKRKRGWGYYVALAIEYGYKVKFVEFIAEQDQLEALAARNKHFVDVAKLRQMLAAWEPLPDWCEVEKRKVVL